jgi:hypothetical protein
MTKVFEDIKWLTLEQWNNIFLLFLYFISETGTSLGVKEQHELPRADNKGTDPHITTGW